MSELSTHLVAHAIPSSVHTDVHRLVLRLVLHQQQEPVRCVLSVWICERVHVP